MLQVVNMKAMVAPRRAAPDDRGPAAAVVALTLLLLVWSNGMLCPDVSGQLWIAHAMRRGARLYVDIVEINPPLWFWMAMPVDALAEALGIRPEPLMVIVTGAAVLAAILATGRLIAAHDGRSRLLFLLYLAVILLIAPARLLEQREHLALVGAVPYLALAAARREGRKVDRRLAAWIGIGAAISFALKPHFLVVPMLVELWLLATCRRQWRPLRTETIALALGGIAYVAAVLAITPAYLTVIVPMFTSAYQGTAAPLDEMFNILTIVWVVTAVCVWIELRARQGRGAPLTVAMLIGAGGFAIAWMLQHKGWLYQGYPVGGAIALALGAVMLEAGRPSSFVVRLLAPLLLLWPPAFALNDVETRITPENDLAPAFAELRSGDAFALIATRGATTWPATVGRNLRLSTRHGQYWMLGALDARPDDPAIRALVQRAISETAFDLRCLPPKVIVFRRQTRDPANRKVAADPFLLFARDPAFAAVLGHYRLWRTGPTFDAWRQVSPLPPMDHTNCRRPG